MKKKNTNVAYILKINWTVSKLHVHCLIPEMSLANIYERNLHKSLYLSAYKNT